MCLLVNNTQKSHRNTVWLSLEKTEVYADLSLGLVSQKWLEKFPIHEGNEY